MEVFIDVKLVETEPLRIFSTRRMGAWAGFEERYAGLYRRAFQKHLQVVGAPVAIYHDENFDGQIRDFEVGLPVKGDSEGVRLLPGGLHCCATHQGSYSTLPSTHFLLGMWILKNGYRITGAPYEVYVRGGNDKILSPDQYVTEIYVPVEKERPAGEA